MGFSQGISGLNAANEGLDVIGNNIANSQTIGFKEGGIHFSDMFSGSEIGGGVQVSGINQNFSDGTLVMGSGPLDMGIQGNGFFQMQDKNGNLFYTRNGQFKTDSNGYIINDNNLFLTGYQATGNPPSIHPGSDVGPIKIPNGPMSGHASGKGKLSGNLDSNSDVIDPKAHPFDPDDKDSYNYTSQMDAYDSLGNKHTINLYYVKTGDNQWTVYSNDSTSPNLDPSKKPVYQQTTLNFDSSGKLITKPATLHIQGGGYKGASPLNFDLDLTGTTQQGGDNAMDNATTDGYPTGDMSGYSLDDKGNIVASYTNGQKQIVGQIVLGEFTNNGGLKSDGNNCWSATNESGKVVLGTSGMGNLGTLQGNKLESSNVDLGKEMVDMIVYQRDYQSNAQTIKAQDQILQTLVNL